MPPPGPAPITNASRWTRRWRKSQVGMTILIREGSAARNFAALHPLLCVAPDRCMFCTDDLHPDNLVHGHIDRIVARAVAEGARPVRRACGPRPSTRSGITACPSACCKSGDPADFIVVDDLHEFRVRQTYIDGQLVAEDGRSLIDRVDVPALNRWGTSAKRVEQFHVPAVRRPGAGDRSASTAQLVTNELHLPPARRNGRLVVDVGDGRAQDRRRESLRRCPTGRRVHSRIRSDSAGRSRRASPTIRTTLSLSVRPTAELCAAVNAVIEAKGGLSAVVDGDRVDVLAAGSRRPDEPRRRRRRRRVTPGSIGWPAISARRCEPRS